MPVISNVELKRRLEAHNFPVPPITDSTKKVLLKKLFQLDKEANQQQSSSKLIDYSSAEEDNNSPNLRRRRPLPSSATSTNGSRNSRRSNANFKVPDPVPPRKSNARELLHISDEEDEENQSSSSEEDDEEEEEEETETVNRSLQISLDDTLNSPASNGTNGKSPGTNGTRKSNRRFSSGTPAPPVRSTASYLNGHSPKTSTPSTASVAFSPNSPLRKAVAKNRDAFGSLGEALASLSSTLNPSNSQQSSTSTTTDNVVTQAPKTSSDVPMATTERFSAKRPSSVDYFSVSVSIILLAFLFFGLVALKYFSLRPRIDIENRLLVCQEGKEVDGCISAEFATKCNRLFAQILPFIEEQSARSKCSTLAGKNDYEGVSVTQIIQSLEDAQEWQQESHGDIMSHLIHVMETTPQFGIALTRKNDQVLLLHENPQVDWSCYIYLKFKVFTSVATYVLIALASMGFVSLIGYFIFRLYKWRSEVLLREQQDVFELVEQVLSLLMKHHHHLALQETGSPRSNSSRTSLPVNHIRDQLILPQDRKRKRHVWAKVVEYIHDSESRVREDVQLIYGEEHKVWQWIPEVNWNPISHPGPNPYVAPLHVMSSPTTAAAVLASTPNLGTMKSVTSRTSTPATPTSSRWQGSAFASLSRNVGAPTYAPSSCLKVRHMFDRKVMSKNDSGWIKQVTEEILHRCSTASICHIAVDKESHEGCVYIKALTNDDAAIVFKTLHGQWYRGNLVTAKYLRDERYFEKFPDAKNHTYPMGSGFEAL